MSESKSIPNAIVTIHDSIASHVFLLLMSEKEGVLFYPINTVNLMQMVAIAKKKHFLNLFNISKSGPNACKLNFTFW